MEQYEEFVKSKHAENEAMKKMHQSTIKPTTSDKEKGVKNVINSASGSSRNKKDSPFIIKELKLIKIF